LWNFQLAACCRRGCLGFGKARRKGMSEVDILASGSDVLTREKRGDGKLEKRAVPARCGPGVHRLNHPHRDLVRSIAIYLASPPTPWSRPAASFDRDVCPNFCVFRI